MYKEDLKKEFEKDLENLTKKIIQEVYTPTKLISLCKNNGYFETAVILANDVNGSSGYIKLMTNNPPRPDLLIENLVIREKYKSLFDEKTLKLCRRKFKKKTKNI